MPLLVQLNNLETAYDEKGRQVTVDGEVVWQDLPLFWVIGDEFYGQCNESNIKASGAIDSKNLGFGGPQWPDGPSDLRVDGLDLQGAVSLWYNNNHFTALLTKTDVPMFNYREGSLVSLAKVLDQPNEDAYSLRWWVPGAAAWLLVDARRIFNSTKKFRMGSGKNSTWDGEPGFSKARWAFWKIRFREIAGNSQVDQVTCEIATRVVEQMDQAEIG